MSTVILRELGFGKSIMEERIQEEITHYIKAIEDHDGEVVNLPEITYISVSNNICSIIFGQRFDYQDATFKDYLVGVDSIMKGIGGDYFSFFVADRQMLGFNNVFS